MNELEQWGEILATKRCSHKKELYSLLVQHKGRLNISYHTAVKEILKQPLQLLTNQSYAQWYPPFPSLKHPYVRMTQFVLSPPAPPSVLSPVNPSVHSYTIHPIARPYIPDSHPVHVLCLVRGVVGQECESIQKIRISKVTEISNSS